MNGKQLQKNKPYLREVLSVRAYNDIGTTRETHEGIYTFGAIGCYLSHIACWQRVADTGIGSFICEDDITFQNWDKFPALEEFKGDLILFGHSVFRLKLSSIDANFDEVDGSFFGLHFYYITPRGARLLLSEAFPLEMQLDNYIPFFKIKYEGTKNTILITASKTNFGRQSGSTAVHSKYLFKMFDAIR